MIVIVNGKKVEVNSTMKVRMNPSSKANSALQKKKRVYYIIGDNGGNSEYREKGWSDIPYDKALALEKYRKDWGEDLEEVYNWFCERGVYGEGFPKNAPRDWYFIKDPTICEL